MWLFRDFWSLSCNGRHSILQTASDLIEIERHLEADVQILTGSVERTILSLRKPDRTPEYLKGDSNERTSKSLGGIEYRVLSGNPTRKWVYLETV